MNTVSTRSAYKPRRINIIPVLDSMIFIDLLKNLLAVLSVLVIIVVSRKFIRILAQAIEGSISQNTVLGILAMKTVIVTSLILPAAIFITVLIVIGRMYREHEMSAIASAGGGAALIYRAVFLLVIPVSLLAGGFSLIAAPWAEAQIQFMADKGSEAAEITGITPGNFNEFNNGESVLYVEDIDKKGRFHKVFVQNKQNGKLGVVNSKFGHLEQRKEGLYLVLEQGIRTQGIPGQQNFVLENFEEYGIRMDKKARKINLKLESRSSWELWESKNIPETIELQDRLSIPLGVIFLCFLAVPLAKLTPRGGVYFSLLIAFFIYFFYGNLQRINHSLIVDGILPAWTGFIGIYVILTLIGIGQLIKLYGWTWVKLIVTGKQPA